MVTEVDEGKGLVKTYWANIRKRVAKVEPTFAKIVDEINPDKSFPIYLAYYPYGALIGDTKHPFFPNNKDGEFKLTDRDVPKDVVKHLSYGKDSLPMGMVLEKNIEWFIDLKNENICIPWVIYFPGTIFPFAKILSKRNNHIYVPNNLLITTSGARSAFVLPNIGCATNHSNLQRDFNVQSPSPKSLYDHWHIFKEIIDSDVVKSDWRSCIIYFSEKWVNQLHNDKAWLNLKRYFYELAWNFTEYRRNHVYYDITFSLIQKKRNLKPNPYLTDTARHLFTTALGAAPGYIPACNNEALPLDTLQKVFVESYGLKKYLPTIMQPTHFNFEQDKYPIYYSFQHPSTHMFSPRSREVSSTLFEMRELEHITRIFAEELGRDNGLCSDTIINKIANDIEFRYFHNKTDRHRIVQASIDMLKADNRFNFIDPKYKVEGAKFASDAPFVRGCISIKTKS